MKQRASVTLGITLLSCLLFVNPPSSNAVPGAATAFDHEFRSIDDRALPLSQFKGKVLLVVNTASFCGFTDQYKGLQKIWSTYKDDGLVVLGVPSNDFGWQEPGSNEQIKTFCEGAFGVTFPLTEKYKVKGADAHKFYQWAQESYGEAHVPKWNFHKYLIGRNGQIVAAFSSFEKPDSDVIKSAIEAELKK